MDQSNLHMHARETSEVLPSISADAGTVTTPLDRKVQQTAQSVPLSSTTSVRPQLLKARELAHAKSLASRPDRARASLILQRTLPSTLAAGRSKTVTSTAKSAHPAPLQRPVSLSRATAAKSSTRMETKTATVGSQAKSVAASTKPAASQAPSEVSLRTRKARGLDFSTPSPHAQLREALRSDSITSHPFKPEAGGNGTTRFLGELVVKGDDRASCEREILFGQTLRTFGVETPQAVAIDKSTLESLRSAVSEYDELFAENEPGSIEIILMPQVKGTSFEQCVQQPNLVEKLRRVAPNMMEKIGHIAAIDMLLSNNDRLVHVNRETRELQELNLVNLGNLMFTIEHGEIAVPVAIDNGGYNSFEKEEQRELDISQFLYHLDHPEKVAEHIMRGLARDCLGNFIENNAKSHFI